jgi:hypothetical protein
MTAVGPLLAQLLDAQRADETAAQYPQVEDNARRVIAYAEHFDQPVLIPVGEAAHRLLAVVDHLARGTYDIPVWTRNVTGRQVLLVGTVAVSMIEFDMTANALRNQGAANVHGCAIDITGATESTLDSFTVLTDHHQPLSKSA